MKAQDVMIYLWDLREDNSSNYEIFMFDMEQKQKEISSFHARVVY
jgi:hypothetical protein